MVKVRVGEEKRNMAQVVYLTCHDVPLHFILTTIRLVEKEQGRHRFF